jgi:membrane protein YdbS with pleckstrin-like domain
MNKLHLGAKWHFRISGYILFGILVIFFGLFGPLAGLILILSNSGSSVINYFLILSLSIIGYIAIVIILSEIYARMSYNRWFYEFNDDGLKLERGIIWKRYSNIPYERIQNVDVHRGIIARMLGFSSIMIQTAGYSAQPGYFAQPQAEGYIPAVEMNEAEKIRNFVIKKITKRK